MDYEELRAEYDAEFGRLRTAVWELRLITQEPSSDKVAEEAARQRVDLALGLYRERRDNLADLLTSHQPARTNVYGTRNLRARRLQRWAGKPQTKATAP